MSSTSDYYKIQREHSRVKSEIVAAYLLPWAKIIGKHIRELKYVDVYSGPGLFEDGGRSTPMLILDEVGKSEQLQKNLRITFYEGDSGYHKQLVSNVSNHESYRKLSHIPVFPEGMLSSEKLASQLSLTGKGTFTFIDPFGYSEISLDLLDAVSKDWGCDSLSYVSISGLTRNILEAKKEPNIRSFFGDASFERLRDALEENGDGVSRSEVILSEIDKVLQQKREFFVLKYCIEFDKTRCPSHYLLFLSKSKLGLKIMRDIMIARSLKDEYGLPMFMFSPRRGQDLSQVVLPLYASDILYKLSNRLKSQFKNKTILVDDIYTKCLELGYEFQQAHIIKALTYLKSTGTLSVIGADGKVQGVKRLTKMHLVRFN